MKPEAYLPHAVVPTGASGGRGTSATDTTVQREEVAATEAVLPVTGSGTGLVGLLLPLGTAGVLARPRRVA